MRTWKQAKNAFPEMFQLFVFAIKTLKGKHMKIIIFKSVLTIIAGVFVVGAILATYNAFVAGGVFNGLAAMFAYSVLYAAGYPLFVAALDAVEKESKKTCK